jgi:hypothetical protein
MLRYAHENGCPWNIDQCRTASKWLARDKRYSALARYLNSHSTCADGQQEERPCKSACASSLGALSLNIDIKIEEKIVIGAKKRTPKQQRDTAVAIFVIKKI